jgi:hypothetical protein
MSGEGSRLIAALAGLARMKLDADLARLRAATEAAGRTEARINGLTAAAARQAEIAAQDLEAPVAGQVLARWGAWAEVRRIELNSRLAQERAEIEARRQATLGAFGRTEALRLAGKRVAEAERREALRRARQRGGGAT